MIFNKKRKECVSETNYLRKALEFYADEEIYEETKNYTHGNIFSVDPSILEDKGEIAREALRKSSIFSDGIRNNNLWLILLWIIDKIIILALFLIFKKIEY